MFTLTAILFPSVTNAITIANKVIAKAISERAFMENEWLSLVHYRRQFLGSGWESEADNPLFFLSPLGHNSPKEELIATIRALFSDSDKIRSNSRCTFPARYQWIRERFALSDKNPLAGCNQLNAWLSGIKTNKLSIFFASSYLENPSSMFGHTFLRFHDDEEDSLLLSRTESVAADTSDQHGAIDFMMRGLFGGFFGVPYDLPFYRLLRMYTEDEGRDLWEYDLKLTPHEIRFLALHIWEIKNNTFNYDFIKKNCSYLLLTILAVAKPRADLRRGFAFYAIPADTIRAIVASGLVENVHYWPSATKDLYHMAGQLSAPDRKLAAGLATGEISLSGDWESDLSVERKSAVLDVADKYLALLVARGMVEQPAADERVKNIVIRRMTLGLHHNFKPIQQPTTRPDQSHKSSRLSLAVGAIGKNKYVGLSFRIAYHGLMDPLSGFDRGSEISVLNAEYRIYQHTGGSLERIDLLRVQSRVPRNIFFTPLSWSFHISRLRKEICGERPQVNSLGFSLGSTFAYANNTISIMPGINLDQGGIFSNDIGAEALIHLGALSQNEHLGTQLYYEYASYVAGADSHRSKIGLAISIPQDVKTSVFFDIHQLVGNGLSQMTFRLQFNYYL